jgi:NAD+ synthase (glutamine-hydrolysing)
VYIPLSGGADSAATVTIVGSMCKVIMKEIKNENKQVIKEISTICGKEEGWLPKDDKEIANILCVTCYLGTKNSSEETRERAKLLAEEVGTYHIDSSIDVVVDSFTKFYSLIFNKEMKFKVEGGTYCENIALQNIQARSSKIKK